MIKVYNTQEDLAIGFKNFFKTFDGMRKTQLNIMPYILHGMIEAESSSVFDISRELKDKFSLVKVDSTNKRIRRFFNNKLFDSKEFFKKFIRKILLQYKKKHADMRVHIIFDHMFSHENYFVLMFTMRIGKQGIPIFFKCYNDEKKAFVESEIIDAIKETSELFDGLGFELIFLADRWFNHTNILRTIESLNHTYVIRCKRNVKIKHFDIKENNYIRKTIGDLQVYKYHSKFYENIIIGNNHQTKVVTAPASNGDDPFIIITNGNPRRALKDYSYRFGGIETVFKNQKSNGFRIESTSNASLKSFETMYTMVCVCVTFLTIIGADYSKNTKCYKDEVIRTHTKSNNKKIRIISIFNTGLTLYKRAFNSLKYIRIPFSFILYDI